MRGRTRAASAALALCFLLFAGAGCGGGSPTVGVEGGVNPEIRLADCTDWQKASAGQRLTTVKQLENFAGGQADSPAGRGALLTEDEALNLFENTCDMSYARAYKLYKLYERAASFAGH